MHARNVEMQNTEVAPNSGCIIFSMTQLNENLLDNLIRILTIFLINKLKLQ